MFLVTYNFADMPINHMTFLRHRIFLVPVEEGTEGKDEASPGGGVLDRKRILCYLIHLRHDWTLLFFAPSFTFYKLFQRCTAQSDMLKTNIDSLLQWFEKKYFTNKLFLFVVSYFFRFQSSKSGKIYLHNDIRLLFSRKSIEVDTGIPYELKSFTEVPRNPKYSPRMWPLAWPFKYFLILKRKSLRYFLKMTDCKNDGNKTWWRLDEMLRRHTETQTVLLFGKVTLLFPTIFLPSRFRDSLKISPKSTWQLFLSSGENI